MAETNTQIKQANMTVYCAGSNLNGLKDKVLKLFGKIAIDTKGDNDKEFSIKLQDNSLVGFSVMTKPEVVMSQNTGMANFFAKAPLANEAVKKAALQQMSMFTAIIGVTFPMTEDRQRTAAIIGAIFRVAKSITAFVLYPTMELYHPDSKLLISSKGATDYSEYYPIVCREMIMPNIKESEADKARAKKNNDILRSKNLPCPEGMPVSAFDENTVIPDKETIIKRAVAIFAAAMKSEVYGTGENPDAGEKLDELLDELSKRYGDLDYLSREEKAYIDDDNPTQQDINKFGWRYECCAVMLWSLGLIDIDEPDEICDAAQLGKILWPNDMASLMEKANVKSKEELLDKQDLSHRYDWACIESRIKNMEIRDIQPEVVVEWHYALNWLTGVEGVTDWDKVPRNA